jgi:hypothetical protein
MTESSTFDRLASELSTEERRDLLERIQGSSVISDEPFFRLEAVAEAPVDYAARYRELNPFVRFVIFLRRLFTGRSRDDLVKDIILKAVWRHVELGSPGLISYSRRVFLERMLDELKTLRDSARFFYDLLDRTIEKDRSAFYAFLASMELEEAHQKLLMETDPFQYARTNSLATEPEIRAAVTSAFESVISTISEDSRRRMYMDVRSLTFLKRIAAFLYDRLFACFEEGPTGGLESPFVTARDQMVELADALYSMASPPSVKLMESLLVFLLRDEMEKPDFDAEQALKIQLAQAEGALSAIRIFNARVPLYTMLRLVLEDPNYRPRELAGGEDWFAIYKNFWKDRMDKQLQLYSVERRLQDLQSNIAGFLGTSNIPHFSYISEEGKDGSPPIRLERALGFLLSFYEKVFIPEMNRPLKLLLIEGEFYRKDNRVEYTDAYNEMLQIADGIAALDKRMGPGGDLGTPYVQARSELVALPIKRRKVQSALQAANNETEVFLRRAREAMGKLHLILKGVLKAEAGGKYDSISNLSFIEGKANKEYLRNLDSVKTKLERTISFLGELEKLGVLKEPS